MLHHIELWVPDLPRAEQSWGRLLSRLGYTEYQRWPEGVSWTLGGTYVVAEQSPALSASSHDRRRPGLNHLAFHGGSRMEVDALVADATSHGWALMFHDQHPFAGGPDHYAAYLRNEDGFEAEIVAGDAP
ncbi:glyoxalase [Myceligenerans sp. I2]|uniref:Glyoxalase n=2 Tax=Myceligenerans indicum TaxID=2593663 RepID=A0ABS1LLX3_9MICO|nr:glyoxalase [Myceligenerans indicum]